MEPHCISISNLAPPGSRVYMPLSQESPVSTSSVVFESRSCSIWNHSSTRLSGATGSASGAGTAADVFRRRRLYCVRVASLGWTFLARSDRKSASAVAVMPNAKGFFPEDHPHYVGIYWGEVGSPQCQAIVDWSDLIVAAGPV